MNDRHTTESAALTTSGIAGVIAGAGIVTFALFPLAIPFLLLTAVFTAPLVLIAIVPALAVGIIVALVLAIRAIGRRLGRRHDGKRSARARSRSGPRERRCARDPGAEVAAGHDTGGQRLELSDAAGRSPVSRGSGRIAKPGAKPPAPALGPTGLGF